MRVETAPQILGPTGPLSPTTSKALMERLIEQGNPANMLQRYTRLMDAISGSPLVTGNKATLLTDGHGRYVYFRRPGAVSRVSYSAGGTGKLEVVADTSAYAVPHSVNVFGRQYEGRPDGKILLFRQPPITPHLLLAVNWFQSIQRMLAEDK